jgi:hypothetical protein
VLEFVRRVQPILLNRCGNASCHGPEAANGLRLSRVRLGQSSHRLLVERNLATALRFVDAERPRTSPLLTLADGKHAPTTLASAAGALDLDQQNVLKDWVVEVAATVRESNQRESKRAAEQQNLTDEHDPTIDSKTEADDDSGSATRPNRPQRPDPFDPTVFNRSFRIQPMQE